MHAGRIVMSGAVADGLPQAGAVIMGMTNTPEFTFKGLVNEGGRRRRQFIKVKIIWR